MNHIHIMSHAQKQKNNLVIYLKKITRECEAYYEVCVVYIVYINIVLYCDKISICHTLNIFLETDEDCIDEGIDEGDKRWDDETEEERNNTKDLEHIIEVSHQTKQQQQQELLTFSFGISTFWQAADKLAKHECKLNQIKVLPSELYLAP